MKLVSFQAKNFKGIEDVHVRFSETPNGGVYCFVGLNESGKTTVLEALDAYKGWTETLKPVTSAVEVEKIAFIPKSRISNFTGSISFVVTFRLEPSDEAVVKAILKVSGYEVARMGPELVGRQEYTFVDSVYQGESESLDFHLETRLEGEDESDAAPEAVVESVRIALRARLPALLYFPNALFETPDQIVLDETGGKENDAYYRKVLQDALDALGEGFNLQRHITARIGESDEEPLNNTVSKLQLKISKVVFDAWKQILGDDLTGRRITLKPMLQGGVKVLRIRYTDGPDSYKVSERSLGFRWFFGFLLLTTFRIGRAQDDKQVVYAFDEPASNLHSSAQQKLLETFGRLSAKSLVLYSTHSHHLIKPDWLENAYVVRNLALSHERAVDESYTARSARVAVEKYRSFVAKHPTLTTFYQPILDVLQYRPSQLEIVPSLVLVEGKNDFYTLRWFQCLSECPSALSRMHFAPGTGAGSLDTLITLYLGWGAEFVVLLDGDGEGKRQRQRYDKKFGSMVAGRLRTLDEVGGGAGSMESMFTDADRDAILHAVGYEGGSVSKQVFNACVQEACARRLQVTLVPPTVSRFVECLQALAQGLARGHDEAAARGVSLKATGAT